MKITKNRYLMSFVAIVLILAMIRLIFPDVAKDKNVNRPVVVNDALMILALILWVKKIV